MTHTPPPRPILSSNTLENVGTAHTPPPRSAKKQVLRGHIEQSTVVQCSEQTADLRKVRRSYENPKLEKLQSVDNGGLMERFCDVGTLIEEWEEMEKDQKEWEVVEGIRRGGRRVSKRMGELLGRFEGGGETETENMVENESCAKPNLSNNLSSFSSISKNTLSTGSHFQRRTKTLTSTVTSNQNSTLNSNSSNSRKVYKLARSFNNSKIQNRNDAKL